MQLVDRLGGELPRGPVTVELDDIQATVLRYRPEPYYGTHVMLHVDDARSRPRIPAAADATRRLRRRLVEAGEAWISVGDQLRRAGGAGRAGGLAAELPGSVPGGDGRARRTSSWTTGERSEALGPPFGSGQIHIGVSVFSDSEEKLASRHGHRPASSTRGFSGVTVLMMQDFGAQPGDLNPLGYKDGSASPPSRAAASSRCPARDDRSRPASSSSAIPARPACRCRCRGRTCWGATARSSGCASTSRASGRSTGSCASNAEHGAGAGAARGEAGGALAQRRAVDARADARRPGARRRPAAEQRLHLRRRSARPAGAARLAHAAHEPARHRDWRS